MENDKPLVSILLPVYNEAVFLRQCLDSLLSQTYPNIEIIAFDDHSTDISLKILKSYKKIDKRLLIHKNIKKYGLQITLNRALRKAKGKFIALMSPKDIATPDRIKRQLSYLLNNQKTVAVGTQCTFLDATGKKIGKSDFPYDGEEIQKNPFHGISILFEAIMINKYRLPKDVLHFDSHQQSLLYSSMLMKLMAYGTICNLPYILYAHRENTKNAYQSFIQNSRTLTKFWFQSFTSHNHLLSPRSLLSTFIKPKGMLH